MTDWLIVFPELVELYGTCGIIRKLVLYVSAIFVDSGKERSSVYLNFFGLVLRIFPYLEAFTSNITSDLQSYTQLSQDSLLSNCETRFLFMKSSSIDSKYIVLMEKISIPIKKLVYQQIFSKNKANTRLTVFFRYLRSCCGFSVDK